jgi:hypothetical protein
LRPHLENPRWFTDGSGRAIYLTGSHTWANLQDSSVAPLRPFDWKGYIEMMVSHNHNFMRLWSWHQAAWAPWTPDKVLYEPTLYRRPGPGTAGDGGPKFDLDQFNPAYFDRMRDRVTECRDEGIYVAVQLFQGFSVRRPRSCGDPWPAHPYNADNNINGFNGDKDGDGTPDLWDPEVRKRQAAYLQNVVDTVEGLDNVLYEVINEGGEIDWDWWVVNTVHEMEAKKGKRHPVGLTGYGAETLQEMLASPAEWISAGSRDSRRFQFDPPVWDGSKVSVNDTDHLWGHGGMAPWAWMSFVRGHNTLLMDAWDPIPGKGCPDVNWGPRPGYPRRDLNRRDDPTWEPVRQAIGHVRYYADRMNLVHMLPTEEIASTKYCLANPGREYLVYLPDGNEVNIDLSAVTGEVVSEWMHPVTGEITPGGRTKPGKGQTNFAVPFLGPAVLYIRKV